MNELIANKAFRIALTAVLAVLALFLLVKTWDGLFGYQPGEPLNTITVSGTGSATAVPDIAKISFTVTESAASVAAAQKAATDRTDKALEALAALGVEDKDVKTLYYNVNPRYEYNTVARPCALDMPCPPVSGSPTITGYDVSQSVEVTVRDTAKAGDVLQALGTLGVQNISGPNFTVDDADAAKTTARKEAIDKAHAQAKLLAKQLGVRLGRIVSFNEGGYYPMYEAYGKGGDMMNATVSSAPALPAGENETNVTVQITYEIR
jgi:uncharacterized protein YggE